MNNDETMVDVPRMSLVRLLRRLDAALRITPEYGAMLDALYPMDASVTFSSDTGDPSDEDETAS